MRKSKVKIKRNLAIPGEAMLQEEFVALIKEAEKKQASITEDADEYKQIRYDLLSLLEKDLGTDVKIYVDKKNGVLRLQDGHQQFLRQGEHELTEFGTDVSKKIATSLKRYLDCKITPIRNLCNKSNRIKIENIFIEGHADQAPIEGQRKVVYEDNLGLSARRAKFAYGIFQDVFQEEGLKELKNLESKSIVNISAYGNTRLIKEVDGYHDLPSQEKRIIDQENRRIDLRFIMHQPEQLRGISSEK